MHQITKRIISMGKMRGMQQCANERGVFTVLALDHRQNLRRALNPEDPSAVGDGMLSDFKVTVCRALSEEATAVLLDPEFGAAQALASAAIPGQAGLVVALEATGYTGDPAARQSRILPGWSVPKARRMGASMLKLLVYYHPDAPTAPEIETFVAEIANECTREDVALMLEPLSYPLDPASKSLPAEEKRRVVVATAMNLSAPGVDLMKLEFPEDPASSEVAWQDACREVSSVCPLPWILLSAAVDFETYLSQVGVACRAGASGVAVGRAVWKEAVALDERNRPDFLRQTAAPRLRRLGALSYALARPWTDFFDLPAPDHTWYSSYLDTL